MSRAAQCELRLRRDRLAPIVRALDLGETPASRIVPAVRAGPMQRVDAALARCGDLDLGDQAIPLLRDRIAAPERELSSGGAGGAHQRWACRLRASFLTTIWRSSVRAADAVASSGCESGTSAQP